MQAPAAAAANVPAPHGVQLPAPVPEYKPTAQRAQLVEAVLPVATAKLPAAQPTHLVVPVPLWYWPAAQLVHCAAPAAAAKVPTPQDEHSAEPAEAYLPVAHAEQKPTAENLPAGQLVQLVDAAAPVATRKAPAAQLVQAVLPVVLVYWPGAQGAHVGLATAAEEVPAAQLKQPQELATENAPALQPTQLAAAVAPSSLEYVPATHLAHLAAPVAAW